MQKLHMVITIILSACRQNKLSACRRKSLSFYQPADGNHYHSISLQMENTITISLQTEIIIILSACRWKSWFAFSTFSGQPASPLEALFTNPLKTHKELSIKTQISTAVRLIFHRKKRTAEEGKNPLPPPPPPPAPSFQSFSFEAIPTPATSCFHIDILCAVPSTNTQKSKSWHYQVTLRTRHVTGIKGSVTNEN